jgi:hypothetical protein
VSHDEGTGRAPAGSTPTRRRRVRGLVALLVVVLVAAVAAAAAWLTRSHPRGSAQPPPVPSSAGSPSATACRLRVVESGLSNQHDRLTGGQIPAADGDIVYGFVVENPCPRTAVGAYLGVTAIDAAGHGMSYDDGIGGPYLPYRLPALQSGHRIGVGGGFPNGRRSGGKAGAYDATKVVSINIAVERVGWQAASALPDQVTAIVSNVRVGARGEDGYASVTFTLRLEPPQPTGETWGSIIVRDASGRIVSGEVRRLDLPLTLSAAGESMKTAVWVPPTGAPLHADIYYVPGGF